MEEKLYLVRYEATPINSDIVTHVDVREVYAKDPKEATITVFNILRVLHPEFGALRCSIVERPENPAPPQAKEPEKTDTEKAE